MDEIEDDTGGDPACWAHLDDEHVVDHASPFVVDVGGFSATGDGVFWSLPHGGDLDANMVRLGAGGTIGEHRNDEVDVLVFVQSGAGEAIVDSSTRRLGADHIAFFPRGSTRSITAGPTGLIYLSVHRRRDPLPLTARAERR